MRAAAFLVACLALSTLDTPAAQVSGGSTAAPRVTNGRLAAQPVGASLDAAFKRLVAAQSEPAWIGYTVPAVSRAEGRGCCSGDTWISDGIVFTNGRIATCGLESSTLSPWESSYLPSSSIM